MARLPILRYPDPGLHTVASPVSAVDERIRAKHDIKLPRAVMEPGDPRWTRI